MGHRWSKSLFHCIFVMLDITHPCRVPCRLANDHARNHCFTGNTIKGMPTQRDRPRTIEIGRTSDRGRFEPAHSLVDWKPRGLTDPGKPGSVSYEEITV